MLRHAIQQRLHRHRAFTFHEAMQGLNAGMPGAEILGSEILSHRFAQIFVHIARCDVFDIAVIVDIFEKILARQILHPAHDPRQAVIRKRHFAQLAGFSFVPQPQRVAGQFGVALAQCRCPEALVRFRVTFVANTDSAQVEQAYDTRHSPFPGQLAAAKIFLHPFAHQWQQAAERDAFVELFAFACGTKIRVVAILLASLGVDTGCQNMAVGGGTEPCVDIGRWQGDRIQPSLFSRIGDQRPFGIVIGPAPPCTLAGDTGQIVVDIDELRHCEGKNLGMLHPVPHLATNGEKE